MSVNRGTPLSRDFPGKVEAQRVTAIGFGFALGAMTLLLLSGIHQSPEVFATTLRTCAACSVPLALLGSLGAICWAEHSFRERSQKALIQTMLVNKELQ